MYGISDKYKCKLKSVEHNSMLQLTTPCNLCTKACDSYVALKGGGGGVVVVYLYKENVNET